jgi:hypothetical protein
LRALSSSNASCCLRAFTPKPFIIACLCPTKKLPLALGDA